MWRTRGPTLAVAAALAILAAVAVLAVVGYLVMLDVKPKVDRPVMAEEARRAIGELEDRLMGHVRTLGGEIGERHLLEPQGLLAAADYIRERWSSQGFSLTEQAYELFGQRCANLIVEQRGANRPEEIVLVGAHYDSIIGSPGANDNATGVAVLLEMSRMLSQTTLSRTVRFVAFVNEEPPYFHTEQMGSRLHAREARERGEDIVAMISLETLGFYSETRGSQRYPFPFGALYPDTGNFLGVVGNLTSRGLVVDVLRHFMRSTDFPVEGAATFSWIPGVDWSDQWSFWKEGYRAVMLTDTALYRYPEYHSFRDLPEKINASEFARAAHGIIGAVRQLASAP